MNATNLRSIVNDILDYAKIDSGKIVLENHVFNLKENLRGIIDSFLFSDKKNANVEFKANFSADLPGYIVSDSGRLNQILINLISNSLKFTNSGTVTVTARLVNTDDESFFVDFSVADTGIGIAENNKEFVFNAFTQATDSTSRLYGGTGLGLSIVKNLCHIFGTDINLTTKLGYGSVFYFSIKFKKALDMEIQFQEDTGEGNHLTHPIQILLVEDNEFNRMVAIDTLISWQSDMQIDIAENGQICIDKFIEKDYDIILMDIQMPVMDGYEASKYIRSKIKGKKSKIPILAMSANAFIDDIKKSVESGMNDYITKPFEPNNLFSKIEHLLDPKNGKPKIKKLRKSS